MLPNSFDDYARMASDWFWQMDAGLRYTAFLGRFEAMTGRPASGSIGLRRSEVAANAHDRAFWQAHEEDLARRRPFRDFQYPFDHPDGRRRWFRISGEPVFDEAGTFLGYRGVGTDVTAEQDARDGLVEQKRQLDAALAHMPHGLIMTDAAERVVLCNDRFLDLFGLDRSIVHPGLTMPELIAHGVATGRCPGETAGTVLEARARHLAGEHSARSISLADGRIVDVEFRPVSGGGWVTTYEDVTDRRTSEHRLAEQGRRFDAALGSMPAGLCLFDAEARLAVWNRRYEEIYGLSPGQLYEGMPHREIVELGVGLGRHRAGRTVDEIHDERMAMASGERTGTCHQALADGRIVEIICRPAPQDGWIATYEDVTERLSIERQVTEQNLRFDAALAHMSHGLLMVDTDDRVVLVNAKFKEFYRLSSDAVVTGMPMREVIERSVGSGNFPGMTMGEIVDRRRARLALGEAVTFRQPLPGGRILDVHSTPLSGGRGWVTVYDDVTEQANADARVVEQNGRFDAALNNMAEGLLMLDRNLRVIVCNERYREMLRLPADVAKPGATLTDIIAHGVAQGRHPGSTLDAIMESRRAIFARGEPATLQMMLDDRVIETCFQPMETGGWVATYSDVTARKQAEARIIHMARHDALTDLPNRTFFHDRMVQATASGASIEGSAVLCLDLDRFKAVNDTLGHAIGDRLLKEVTTRLKAALPEAAILARLGGDEFAVLLAQAGPEAASLVAKSLVEEVCRGYEIGDHRVNVGLSVGIALAPADGRDPDQLLRAADMALYRAKEEGRGTYRFFEHDMDARMQARRQLELDLRQALAGDQFRLHYQPLVTMDTGRIAGFEALVRWHHPVRGLVAPAEFIPIAEEIGLIVPLGDWILREACREAATWPSHVRVAVNLSPVQFRSPALVLSVVAALGAAGLAPDRLEVEITEGVLLQDTKATIAILHDLKTLGVHIAMDDFGTGYSSLGYLRAFPFDKIKIDRSFIADLASREDAIAIIKAITGLGASLGMTTTAEGIETLEQLERLRGEGCHEVQGYLFSRPKPGSEVQAMLAGQEGLEALTRAA